MSSERRDLVHGRRTSRMVGKFPREWPFNLIFLILSHISNICIYSKSAFVIIASIILIQIMPHCRPPWILLRLRIIILCYTNAIIIHVTSLDFIFIAYPIIPNQNIPLLSSSLLTICLTTIAITFIIIFFFVHLNNSYYNYHGMYRVLIIDPTI